MRNAICTTLAGLAALSGAFAQAPARRVAITIDDGPAVNAGKDLGDFQRIARGLLSSLEAEKVPATIFINERQLNVPGQRDGRAAVLEMWLDAGYNLANHSYSHPSANKVSVREFEEDIVKGDTVMRPLIEARGKKLEWFRYPFLDSGNTQEDHQKIADFLEQHHYKVAHVTVDYADYSFAGAWQRLVRAGDTANAERVKQAYFDQIDVGFDHAEKASMEVLGYELPQILLIHCNELNSLTLRESIARMRKRGYSFITLDDATKDPAYLRPDTFAGNGGSWLQRTARATGKKITAEPVRFPQWITDLPRAAR